MKATLASLVFVAGALAQTFVINTPANAAVCQPLLINWTGGVPPYFLSILPGGQPGAAPLVDLGKQEGNSVTWVVNQAQGTSLGLNLRDNTGAVVSSAAFIVNPGTDTSCVGHDPSTSAGGSAPATGGATTPAGTTSAGATTPAPATTAPPATTPPASTPATTTKPASSAPASSASRSSAAASGTPTSGASANFAQVGVAGAVGAAIAALLV